jgi:hypothetical protein
MSETLNIYCDESCHLEHDQHAMMVLGALWCTDGKVREIAERLREKKAEHGLSPDFETKWTKVSPGKTAFYLDLVDYFFDDDDLHFRAVVIKKGSIDHRSVPGQTHDDWYYKMLFILLQPLLMPGSKHRIYLDLKDTQSALKASKLGEFLCNARFDFDRKLIDRIQPVRSHEVEQLQLCDLLIGAVCYLNRELTTNKAKLALIERIKKRSTYTLTRSTLVSERKFNIFFWIGKGGA